jgi:hypothetical protein
MKVKLVIAPASGWLQRLVRRKPCHLATAARTSLRIKRASRAELIKCTEANEGSEGRTTRSAAVACELADLLLIFVLLALFPPNENKMSDGHRERASLSANRFWLREM